MGLLDKAREAASQAVTKAQPLMAQGQAKLTEVQNKRAADGLLHDLGVAFYAEQRRGGSSEAVVSALRALDSHVAKNGAIDLPGSEGTTKPGWSSTTSTTSSGYSDGGFSSAGGPPPPTSATGTPPPSATSTEPPAGDYRLDDI